MEIWKKITSSFVWETYFLIYSDYMFEFLTFLVGVMIMGPIVYLYFMIQDLKKRIDNLEKK